MHERQKLREAEYFRAGLDQTSASGEPFIFTLSAFLAAARSVLLYARDEAVSKNGGQAWYDAKMVSPVLSSFKTKRDINIHQAPVVPQKLVNVELTASIYASAALLVQVFDAQGHPKEPAKVVETGPPAQPPEAPTNVSVEYRFSDWPGPEDLMALCDQYLVELRALVADGIQRQLISG
jgi:hypothetical protein